MIAQALASLLGQLAYVLLKWLLVPIAKIVRWEAEIRRERKRAHRRRSQRTR